jgi:hypothetical protein
MKKVIGVLLLVAFVPVWIILYLIALCGIVANSLFELLYEPIYKLAGKPLDRK